MGVVGGGGGVGTWVGGSWVCGDWVGCFLKDNPRPYIINFIDQQTS